MATVEATEDEKVNECKGLELLKQLSCELIASCCDNQVSESVDSTVNNTEEYTNVKHPQEKTYVNSDNCHSNSSITMDTTMDTTVSLTGKTNDHIYANATSSCHGDNSSDVSSTTNDVEDLSLSNRPCSDKQGAKTDNICNEKCDTMETTEENLSDKENQTGSAF
jgi:hypothetical protein